MVQSNDDPVHRGIIPSPNEQGHQGEDPGSTSINTHRHKREKKKKKKKREKREGEDERPGTDGRRRQKRRTRLTGADDTSHMATTDTGGPVILEMKEVYITGNQSDDVTMEDGDVVSHGAIKQVTPVRDREDRTDYIEPGGPSGSKIFHTQIDWTPRTSHTEEDPVKQSSSLPQIDENQMERSSSVKENTECSSPTDTSHYSPSGTPCQEVVQPGKPSKDPSPLGSSRDSMASPGLYGEQLPILRISRDSLTSTGLPEGQAPSLGMFRDSLTSPGLSEVPSTSLGMSRDSLTSTGLLEGQASSLKISRDSLAPPELSEDFPPSPGSTTLAGYPSPVVLEEMENLDHFEDPFDNVRCVKVEAEGEIPTGSLLNPPDKGCVRRISYKLAVGRNSLDIGNDPSAV
ncbi:uncharacterized protein LOC121868371 [Homarus americanus]|nr:uncharacterized protein LOC121868371 [Homarus americanus]